MRDERATANHLQLLFDSYTLSSLPEGETWEGESRRVDERMVREHGTFEDHANLKRETETIVVLCGPPGLIDQACFPNIEKVYGKEMVQKRTFHY